MNRQFNETNKLKFKGLRARPFQHPKATELFVEKVEIQNQLQVQPSAEGIIFPWAATWIILLMCHLINSLSKGIPGHISWVARNIMIHLASAWQDLNRLPKSTRSERVTYYATYNQSHQWHSSSCTRTNFNEDFKLKMVYTERIMPYLLWYLSPNIHCSNAWLMDPNHLINLL